jgi:threonine aldolase
VSLDDLTPPDRSFASDNSAGVHPAILAAIAAANVGHVRAYGYDQYTAAADEAFNDLFGRQVDTFYVWNGTGANVVSLASLLGPAQAVICTSAAHINVDETGAPERILGAKLLDIETPDGKLRPEHIQAEVHALGVEHHAQPGVVSITQSTELGTLYSVDEIAAIADVAHRHGMALHLDGARIANATVGLGGTPEAMRRFTVDAGVDVVSFGGTKNGMMYGEAVVYLNRTYAKSAIYLRKQITQLPSKMRFIAAQFSALLGDGLWLDNARHANAMAGALYDQTCSIPGVDPGPRPAVNAMFPSLTRPAIAALQEWSPFYDWDVTTDRVRWMTSWDTTADDIVRFAAGVRAVLESHTINP